MKRSLTATAVANTTFATLLQDRQKAAKPGATKPKDGTQGLKLNDGGGLYLWLTRNGAKSWRYAYKLYGKERTYTIGSYPEISLKAARAAHDAARALVENNIDPGQHREAETQKTIAAEKNTFKAVALSYVAKRTDPDAPEKDRWTPGYAEKVMRILKADVFPHVGAMKIGDVGAAQISPILEGVAKRKKVKMKYAYERDGKPYVQIRIRTRQRGAALTALHIKSLCRGIFAHAVQKGLVQMHFDPTWALKDVVNRPDVKHAGHLELHELDTFWTALSAVDATERVKLGMELLALTFVRTKELRLAEPNEFHGLNSANPHWIVPAAKMKKRRDHLVPLAPRAVEIVERLIQIAKEEGSPYLFPNRNGKDPLDPNTFNQVLYRMNYGGRLSAHGFRGTASTALHGKGYPPHIIEMQLAHWGGKDKTAASYNHALYAAERAEMMRDWANMLHADHGNVVPFKKKA